MITELKKILKTAKNPLIVILGPTASGKTALSLKIAHQINGEIISTDSRQLYREMEIATDAVLPENRENIPHHLVGIVDPHEEISLAEYKKMALERISAIYRRKHIPMLVGGTGLYISAIIDDYKIPKIPPNKELRQKLEAEAAKKGKEFVHKKLQKLDPEAAAGIHSNNLRYVIRAIEVSMAGKQVGKQTGKQENLQKKTKSSFDVFMIGIEWPRPQLYQRVNHRVDLQIQRGLLDEVKKLLKKGYSENLPSMSSLGVKEIIPYLKDQQSLEECIAQLKQNTRNYAKRQMTWFRRYDNVIWLNPENLNAAL